MAPSRHPVVLSLVGLLACKGEQAHSRDEVEPRSPAATPPGVVAPAGFVAMDDAQVQRLRATTLRGTATDVELDAWVSPRGPATGLVVSMNTRHRANPAVHGHTLRSWVQHNLHAIERDLAALDAKANPAKIQDDAGSQAAVLTRYAVPLPGGSAMQVWTRAWLSADAHLVEATCQCAGTGCTEPPACTLPPAPADALTPATVLGSGVPATVLTTRSGAGRVEIPPHLTALPEHTQTQLEAPDPLTAPRRADKHVQGFAAADGSAAFLTESTWCIDAPRCDAATLAENRRKAEVASLRGTGTLRSVETRADPHATVPTYGFELHQRDGFWTQSTFWNDGDRVREASCSCAGLACALVQRSCAVNPG